MSDDPILRSVESFDANILEMDGAARIVSLQGERPLVEFSSEVLACFFIGGFGVVDDNLVVDLDNDLLAFDDDGFGIPFVVRDMLFQNVYNAVEASGSFGVALAVVHLGLETVFWPAFILILGVKIDSAVGAWFGFHFGAKFKIDEWLVVADVEQMAAWTVGHDRAILDFPGFGLFVDLPAAQGFSIEQWNESIFVRFRCLTNRR